MTELIYKDEYYRIVECAIKVWKTLGYGFLEKVYENALAIELRKNGFDVQQQVPVKVHYESDIVGEYIVDIQVNGEIVVEVKTCKAVANEHRSQTLNYLKATQKPLAVLLNFGPTLKEHKRLVL